MSYDHWLYRAKPGAGPISGWSDNQFDSLGPWPELEERIKQACTVIPHQSNDQPAWLRVTSVCGPGDYELIPDILGNGHVESFRVRGAWKEDVVFLAKHLDLLAYDPQKGIDVIPSDS